MQNENIMSTNNALQIFRGPMREPMQQINGSLEEDIYASQVDAFLRKGDNNDYENMGGKPHNAFMDQLESEGLRLGLAADDK